MGDRELLRLECDHGESCVIYTQVNEKKKKYGMSVAMCSRTTRCAFKQELKIPLQPCTVHDSLIKVRAFREDEGDEVCMYHCAAASIEGEWCGSWKVVTMDTTEESDVALQEASSHLSGSSLDDVTSGDDTDHAHDDSTHIDTSCDDSTHNDSTRIDTSYDDSTHNDHTHNDSTRIDTSYNDSTHNDHTHNDSTHIDTSYDDSTHIDHTHNDSTHIDTSYDDSTHNDSTHINDSIDEVSSGDDVGHTPVDHTHIEDSSDSEEHDVTRSPALLDPAYFQPSGKGDVPCMATPTTPSQYREVQTIDSDSGDESDGSHDNDVATLISNHTHKDAPPRTDHAHFEPDSPIVIDTPSNVTLPTTSHTHSQYREIRFNSEEREKSGGSHDDNMPSDRTHNDSTKKDMGVTLPPTGPAHTSPVDVGDLKYTLPSFQPAHQFRKLVKQLADRQHLLSRFGHTLPDKGANLAKELDLIKQRMIKLKGYIPNQKEILEYLNKPEDIEGDEEERISVKQKLHSKEMHGLAKQLTVGAVQNLHSSLGSCPGEDVLEEGPEELTVTLMTHQKRALAWLRWREEQIPCGGILADDMGLGKTLSMIALILKQNRAGSQCSHAPSNDRLLQVKATLVVAPLTLLDMWNNEMSSKLSPHTLSVLVYHGQKRTSDYRDFQYYDVVITTYNLVGVEAGQLVEKVTNKKSKRRLAADTLFKVCWNRVILDEAHNIRNSKTATSIGCCGLSAKSRWAMTGTPIQNKLEDFYSLIKFLRVSPFDDLRVWKDTISCKATIGMQRLKAMVACLVLRRTKEEMMSIKAINLPERILVQHELEMDKLDRQVYDIIFQEGRGFFQRYLAEQGEGGPQEPTGPTTAALLDALPSHVARAVQRVISSMITDPDCMENSSKGRTVLVLLLRLRQACSHLNLVCSALEGEALSDDVDMALAMGAISLDDPRQPLSLGNVPTEFGRQFPSAKIRAIVNEMEKIFASQDDAHGKPNKCIVVSQWTSMLNVLEQHLTKRDISFTRIDGKVPGRERQHCVSLFNSANPDPRVMLLSLQAGGVGLTLTGANHVFIIDLHWNPQLEQQAADRCHRVGQTRDVVIHRFIVKNTVEIGIQLIQEKKLKLAEDVLSGADRRKTRRNMGLTLADLKQLFEIS